MKRDISFQRRFINNSPKIFYEKLRGIAVHVVIVFVIIVLGVAMTKLSISQSTEKRARAELVSTLSLQKSAFEKHLSEQYRSVRLVADMLAHGRHFTSEKIQPTLNSIFRTFNLSTLAYVDVDGNTEGCLGEEIGDISGLACFRKIISGEVSEYCEYVTDLGTENKPRVLFMIPAYDEEDTLIGVLVCSKVNDLLEDEIFAHNTLFDSMSAIIICNDEGDFLLANENAHNYFEPIRDDKTDNDNIYKWNEKLTELEEGKTTSVIIDETRYLVACEYIEEIGWKIYSILDETSAAQWYSESQDKAQKIIESVVLAFVILIIYIIILNRAYVRRKNREASIIKHYNDSYSNILSEIHCAVVEFDPDRKTVSTIQENFGNVKLESLHGPMEEYTKLKKNHPEFDFKELEAEIDIVKKHGKSCSFETILSLDEDIFYWLKAKLLPILDDNEKVSRIYCVFFDISDLHRSHESALDTYAKIPGAVHRHILNNPVHINYYSDGLCGMLGFTHAEIDEIIGSNYQYSNLILPEDRQKYVTYINKLAKKSGSATCEYRMICKDGTTVEVSETMDAKYSSSGIMYGYAVVTDLYKYRVEQKHLQQELKTTKEKLVQSRVQNAGSQMQPHFLYNALASIREIVLDDPEYASDLIYDFTTHLRACVRSMSTGSFVPFDQELENINAYVNIEKMRFGDRLQIEYDCPETDFNIIQLSIQPLVENSIRHGIFQRGMTGGKVIVRTMRSKDNVIISVEDNGVGFDYERIVQEIESGIRDSSGLTNLIFRFKSMMNADVTVESKIGNGTKVTVKIPIIDRKE